MDINGARHHGSTARSRCSSPEPGRAWAAGLAERAERRPAAEPGRGGLRFMFYGRVSTEDYQDPVTSRCDSVIRPGHWWPGTDRSWRSSPTLARAGRWRGRAARRLGTDAQIYTLPVIDIHCPANPIVFPKRFPRNLLLIRKEARSVLPVAM
jgi:hypothetical protein